MPRSEKRSYTVVSYNCESLRKQLFALDRLYSLKKFDMAVLQETGTTRTTENTISNKILERGWEAYLNSTDAYEADLEYSINDSRLSPRRGISTGVICTDPDKQSKEYTRSNWRFQIMKMDKIHVVNVYLPVNKNDLDQDEAFSLVTEEIIDRVKTDLDWEEINLAIIGDFNWSKKQNRRRRDEAIERLCKELRLTVHAPDSPTYFGHNGTKSTIDLALVSEGIHVKSNMVVTGDRLPSLFSTHGAVYWTMTISVEVLPEQAPMKNAENVTNSIFKKVKRVDWTRGVDKDLFVSLCRDYLRYTLKTLQSLPPPWLLAITQTILSEAAQRSAIWEYRDSKDELSERIDDLESKIRWKTGHIKTMRRAYLRKEDEHGDVVKLKHQYLGAEDNIRSIIKEETKLVKMKKELKKRVTTFLYEEEQQETDSIMQSLYHNRSDTFLKKIRNKKEVRSQGPKEIFHNDKWHRGNDEVLNIFVTASLEQSGEQVEIPGKMITQEYVERKARVMADKMVAKRDNSAFVPLHEDSMKKLMSRLKNGKAPDINGVTVEHYKSLSPAALNVMIYLFNKILSEINFYSHFLLSISLATMLLKKVTKPTELVNSYRRLQICPVPQKMIQELVRDQIKQTVQPYKTKLQFGFSNGVSFMKAVVCRETVTKLAVEAGDSIYLIAADVAAAFSRTCRVTQLAELAEQGVRGKTFLFCCTFFENTTVVLKGEGEFSRIFVEKTGSPQGAQLSPDFFLIYQVPLDRQLRSHKIGYKVADVDWALLLVADDSYTITEGKENFNVADKIYDHYIQTHRVQYGFDKTNLTAVNPENNTVEDLSFGGYKLKIAEESAHVGLIVCQEYDRTEQVNVTARLAKARGGTFGIFGKVWQERRKFSLLVSKTLIVSVLKPLSIAGLQALCVSDTEMKNTNRFVDTIMRRVMDMRRLAPTTPLYMMMSLAPIICDLHKQVLGLFHNVWCFDDECKKLVNYVLSKRGLRLKFWPTHVDKILKRYGFPSAEEFMARPPMSKEAFKGYVKKKVETEFNNDFLYKLGQSGLYRFVHQSDFDIRRPKMSPILSSAVTRTEIDGQKLALLHICMEYKNGENLHRIRVRETPECEYCAANIDSSEHCLTDCAVLTGSDIDVARIANLREEIITAISLANETAELEVRRALSDRRNYTNLLLNPASHNLPAVTKVSYKSNRLNGIILKCQSIVRLCHLLRKKAERIRNVPSIPPPLNGRRKRKRPSKVRPAHKRHVDHAAKGKNVNKITNYFTTKTNDQVTEDVMEQAEILAGPKTDRNQVILMEVGTTLTPIVAMVTSRSGRDLYNRRYFSRWWKEHDGHETSRRVINLITEDRTLLDKVEIMMVDGLDGSAVRSWCKQFHVKLGPVLNPNSIAEEEPTDKEMPGLLLYLDLTRKINAAILSHSDRQITVFLHEIKDRNYKERGLWNMSDKDWRMLRDCKERLATVQVENLRSWAKLALKEEEHSFTPMKSYGEPAEAMEEMWKECTILQEVFRPGLSFCQAQSTEVQWSLDHVNDLTYWSSTTGYQYKGNVDRMLARLKGPLTQQGEESAMSRESYVVRAPISSANLQRDRMRRLGKSRASEEDLKKKLETAVQELEEAKRNHQVLQGKMRRASAENEELRDLNKTLTEDNSTMKSRLYSLNDSAKARLGPPVKQEYDFPIESGLDPPSPVSDYPTYPDNGPSPVYAATPPSPAYEKIESPEYDQGKEILNFNFTTYDLTDLEGPYDDDEDFVKVSETTHGGVWMNRKVVERNGPLIESLQKLERQGTGVKGIELIKERKPLLKNSSNSTTLRLRNSEESSGEKAVTAGLKRKRGVRSPNSTSPTNPAKKNTKEARELAVKTMPKIPKKPEGYRDAYQRALDREQEAKANAKGGFTKPATLPDTHPTGFATRPLPARDQELLDRNFRDLTPREAQLVHQAGRDGATTLSRIAVGTARARTNSSCGEGVKRNLSATYKEILRDVEVSEDEVLFLAERKPLPEQAHHYQKVALRECSVRLQNVGPLVERDRLERESLLRPGPSTSTRNASDLRSRIKVRSSSARTSYSSTSSSSTSRTDRARSGSATRSDRRSRSRESPRTSSRDRARTRSRERRSRRDRTPRRDRISPPKKTPPRKQFKRIVPPSPDSPVREKPRTSTPKIRVQPDRQAKTRAQEEAEREAEEDFNRSRDFDALDFEPPEEEPLPDSGMNMTYINNMLDGVEEGCDVEVRFILIEIYNLTNKDRTIVKIDGRIDLYDDFRQTRIPWVYDFYTRPSASQRPSGWRRRWEVRALIKFPRSRSREPRYRDSPLGVLISNPLSLKCRYSSTERPPRPRWRETSLLPMIPSPMRPTRKMSGNKSFQMQGNKSSQMQKRPQKKTTSKPSKVTPSVLWRAPRTSSAPAA